ncbi:peptidase S8 [Nakamurella silvestris]|nr:peptidase S8 [Nakamurella silvestris]
MPAVSTSDEAKKTSSFFARAAGTQTVFVRLKGQGAYQAAENAGFTSAAARTAAANQQTSVARNSDRLLGLAKKKDSKATVLYTTSNAIPGVVIKADTAALKSLAADAQVLSITAVVPKKVDNIGAVETTNTLAEWASTGKLGAGVKIGIIDTGIDYTHTDFGGPGTKAAFDAAGHSAPETWETAKVKGGYDFAGDAYNADPNSPSYNPVATPDADPLDCGAHGSHVAGTAAGYGVKADGSTFGKTAAAYKALTPATLEQLKIGPGVAPLADLYALRVFGCEGSTDLVMQALDWALDPNGDHNFTDHLDVINMSLGSDYGPEDDPENYFVDLMATKGIVTVSAMGNAGDLTNVGGTPGNAIRGIAVANTSSRRMTFDQIVVTAPANVAKKYNGQFSVSYNYAGLNLGPLPVVKLSAGNTEGCNDYSTADKAAVAGKVVWLVWPLEIGCGSVARAGKAHAAGAAGIVMSSELPIFDAGLTGSADIPLFQFNSVGTAAVKSALDAGTLQVTFDGSLAGVPSATPELEDLANPSTSRGSNGTLGVVKPDVGAPGTQISSALSGSGDGAVTYSGTSMATPHTAGIAALVKETNPTWTVEQIKADIMNTANHDVYVKPGQTGQIYGPNRVGAGRVDAKSAVSNKLLAYAKSVPGAVSASFGNIEVPIDGPTVTQTRVITVQNTGTTAVTSKVTYAAAIKQPGVTYSVSPATITVAAKAKGEVTVKVTIVPGALKKFLDPTMAAVQSGAPRQYISDASGRLLITPTGGQALRVPVYAAAKPVSTTTSTFRVINGQPSVYLSGTGIGVLDGDTTPTGLDTMVGDASFLSVASVYQLAGTSPKLPRCSVTVVDFCSANATTDSADLRQIGVASDFHNTGDPDKTTVTFAVSTWGNWATPGVAVVPYVDIWTDQESDAPQFEVVMQPQPDSDLFLATLYDLDPVTGGPVSAIWANFAPGNINTNLFNSSVVLLPVALSDLFPDGVPADATFGYRVAVDSYLAQSGGSAAVDFAPADGSLFTFDATDPDLWVGGEGWDLAVDRGGDSFPIMKSENATTDKLMVVHQQGATGQKVDILTYAAGGQVNFNKEIKWMLDNKIATGFTDGFRPGDPVARDAMAAFLYRFAHSGGKAPACKAKPFPDVAISHPFCGEISWLKTNGLSTGFADGKYYPSGTIDRQAMAAFLHRYGVPGSLNSKCLAVSGFKDVSRKNSFCGDIRWLTAETGVASGYPDGNFQPTLAVSRQAMSSFLYRYAQLLGDQG